MLSDLASVFAAALTPSSLSVSLSAAPGSRASGFPSLRGLPWAALVPNSPHAATRFSLLGLYGRSLDVWLQSATKGVWSGGCPGGGAGEVGVRSRPGAGETGAFMSGPCAWGVGGRERCWTATRRRGAGHNVAWATVLRESPLTRKVSAPEMLPGVNRHSRSGIKVAQVTRISLYDAPSSVGGERSPSPAGARRDRTKR